MVGEIITDHLELTSRSAWKKRSKMQETWTKNAMRQYITSKKNADEEMKKWGRAIQGWIPKQTIKDISHIAKETNKERKKGKRNNHGNHEGNSNIQPTSYRHLVEHKQKKQKKRGHESRHTWNKNKRIMGKKIHHNNTEVSRRQREKGVG